MRCRIEKRERLIVVHPTLRNFPGMHQGRAHQAMPDHGRGSRSLLLCERKKLRRKIANHVAVERHIVGGKEAVQDREQHKRVFGRLSECFSLFDQQTCPLHSRLGFQRSIPFDMHERGYECDLKLDLLAAQHWRSWQGRDLIEGTG